MLLHSLHCVTSIFCCIPCYLISHSIRIHTHTKYGIPMHTMCVAKWKFWQFAQMNMSSEEDMHFHIVHSSCNIAEWRMCSVHCALRNVHRALWNSTNQKPWFYDIQFSHCISSIWWANRYIKRTLDDLFADVNNDNTVFCIPRMYSDSERKK